MMKSLFSRALRATGKRLAFDTGKFQQFPAVVSYTIALYIKETFQRSFSRRIATAMEFLSDSAGVHEPLSSSLIQFFFPGRA
jgi:hypothetical protein